MHTLLINETTGSEGMMGGGEANHHFDHTNWYYLVILTLFAIYSTYCLPCFCLLVISLFPCSFFNYSLGLAGLDPKF